jgi:hypothetical protein
MVEPADESESPSGVTEEPDPDRLRSGRRRRSAAEEDYLDKVQTDSLKFQPRPDERRSRTQGGFHVNPSILGGIGMMIGAIIWFVVGLSFNYIFFYPPVLFILGVVAFVKGLVSSGKE